MTEPTPQEIADAFLAGCHRARHDDLAKLEKLRRKFAALERERRMLDKAIEAVRGRK